MSEKFEKHNDMLFRILDKPVPLTPDAELPCLVRLIQDDSPMGRNNKNSFISCRSLLYVIDSFVDNKNVVIENGLIVAHNSRFEIIGTHVKEGSAEWRNKQLQDGKAVHRECGLEYYQADGQDRVIGRLKESGEFNSTWNATTFMRHDSDGWQLYEEPEPLYKVGDWVECDGNQRLIEIISRDLGRGNYYHFAYGFGGAYADSITRKISSSEVIVKIGCLEGTVEDLSYADNGRFFLVGKVTERHPVGMYSILYDEMLDAPTRELVESLLKAQKNKENA